MSIPFFFDNARNEIKKINLKLKKRKTYIAPSLFSISEIYNIFNLAIIEIDYSLNFEEFDGT
jgi:hypothetical protein